MKRCTVLDSRLRDLHVRKAGIPLTNREIARELGGCVTEQRISQIANMGLKKLRRRLLAAAPEVAHLFRT